MTPRLLAGTLALGLVLSACGDDADADTVAITASDDACEVASSDLPAGKNTFRVTNEGATVTEVYVYAPGDRVVTERENIGPGTSADFTVDLAAGDYEIACKPGQVGDGIRQAITVSGEGGAALAEAETSIALTSAEYTFDFATTPAFEAGTAVEFVMTNEGELIHEFEVFGPDGAVLGEIGPTDPGDEGLVVLVLDEPGTYEFICDIDDHRAEGMAGTFEVG